MWWTASLLLPLSVLVPFPPLLLLLEEALVLDDPVLEAVAVDDAFARAPSPTNVLTYSMLQYASL